MVGADTGNGIDSAESVGEARFSEAVAPFADGFPAGQRLRPGKCDGLIFRYYRPKQNTVVLYRP